MKGQNFVEQWLSLGPWGQHKSLLVQYSHLWCIMRTHIQQRYRLYKSNKWDKFNAPWPCGGLLVDSLCRAVCYIQTKVCWCTEHVCVPILCLFIFMQSLYYTSNFLNFLFTCIYCPHPLFCCIYTALISCPTCWVNDQLSDGTHFRRLLLKD